MIPTDYIEDAKQIIISLGLPQAQQNERSALCLLALLDLMPGKAWRDAAAPLVGITPMMEWIREHYGKPYAPNTRETVRRHTIHQFVQAGIVLPNPDKADRPVNSPRTVYQIEPTALDLIRTYGTSTWDNKLAEYATHQISLSARYAKERALNRVSVRVAPGTEVKLSPGEHSLLIRSVIEEFAPRFAPGSSLAYIGDTGAKWSYFDADLLADLGIHVERHGKMPDVVLYYAAQNWLLLIEAVTSHGPIDGKRHFELERLFAGSKARLVYITAFPNRVMMARYLADIAWETDVWVADSPSHLVHFDGEQFLGPYH